MPKTRPDIVLAIADQQRSETGTACMTMARDRRWKLVHFADGAEGQLFDLDADPCGVQNLWGDPAHAERRREMVEEILRWRTLTAMTPAPLPAPAR